MSFSVFYGEGRMCLFKRFENEFTLVTCIVALVFTGFICGVFFAPGDDFWAVISCWISSLSLFFVIYIYGQWREQILATKKHDEYQECLLLLIRFSALSSNLIETKKHEFGYLSEGPYSDQYQICNELVGSKNGNQYVIESKKTVSDINLEMICRRELMSTMLGGKSNSFLKSFESFRAISFGLSNSDYEVLISQGSNKARLCVHCPSNYTVLDDLKFKNMLDNWRAGYSADRKKVYIEFNLNDYERLHECFRDLISSLRDDFRDLSSGYVKDIT